jgi:hypothetical protein
MIPVYTNCVIIEEDLFTISNKNYFDWITLSIGFTFWLLVWNLHF